MQIRLGDIDHCDYEGYAVDWLDAHPDAPAETINAVKTVLATGERVDFYAEHDGCPQYAEPV